MVGLAAGGQGCAPRVVSALPDVLIVSMDTVRGDHTTLGGYARDTTPSLAAFAQLPGSVTFTRAYSDAAWSLPAYVSLFTGQHAVTHGVGFRSMQMVPGQPTLAAMLQAHGYQTHAYASGPHLSAAGGMDEGFDEYHHTDGARTLGAQVVASVEWLTEPSEAPRLAFVHGYDAHSPFPTPALLSEMYSDHPRAEPQHCRSSTWRCLKGQKALRVGPEMTDLESHQLVAAYDAAITFADLQLGRILYKLDERGRLDELVVVVLSDHGEMLGEGGGQGHEYGFDDRVFQVPLVVRFPDGSAPRTVSRVVSLSDVLPTLAARLDMMVPSGTQGQVIGELLDPPVASAPHPHRAASKCCVYVRDGDWWLSGVRDKDTMTWSLRLDGDDAVRNADEPDRLAAMQALVAGWSEGLGTPDDVTRQLGAADPALKKALQEGGYWPAETP